ncbi:MAG: PH domain-containing protein [Candidatus Magasanikbacteria bacterium]|jgi:hypothetical protein
MSLAKKINLRQNEEIILIVKAFFFTYFWLYLFGFAFLSGASFFMFWLFSQGAWGYVLYGLAMFVGLFIIFRTWYFNNKNFSIITTERLINVNRVGWFDEYLSVIHFNDIVDVYVRRKGFLPNILNYGSVTIETDDEQASLELNQVKYPQRILDLILEHKNNFVNNKNLRDQDSVYKAFVNIIPDLDEAQLCEIHDLTEEQLKLIDQEIEE